MEKDIVWHKLSVAREQREIKNGHKAAVVWFTGLSGSGKSTLAHYLDKRLFDMSCQSHVFDGDNVRHGLCSDLGFSESERSENIRRIGEMIKLFCDVGVIALAAFISPYEKDRKNVREMIDEDRFFEVYCHCDIKVCEKRDVKGLYKKARSGEIKDYTGISSPYEEPIHPELLLYTDKQSIEECIEIILKMLSDKEIIQYDK